MPRNGAIRRVAVFGGSGFLGRKIVSCLSAAGVDARVAVRSPDKVTPQRRKGKTGAVEPVYADVRDETSVDLALENCDAAVNAVGLYVERGAATFEAVHELGALNVAHQCAEQKVARLVHISGIGADLNSPSKYVKSRAKGELLVRDVFPEVTILRPSVMFAPDDNFITMLARTARFSPVMPLFGKGETRLQPVCAGDVAQAVLGVLRDSKSAGETYELGGAKSCTYRELLELVLARADRRRFLMPVPYFVWDTLAALASFLPAPPLTRDQVALMKEDNVVGEKVLGLRDLGLTPTPLDKVLPRYAL